jgi:hypothetical protein
MSKQTNQRKIFSIFIIIFEELIEMTHLSVLNRKKKQTQANNFMRCHALCSDAMTKTTNMIGIPQGATIISAASVISQRFLFPCFNCFNPFPAANVANKRHLGSAPKSHF